jgi:hypothetical protein
LQLRIRPVRHGMARRRRAGAPASLQVGADCLAGTGSAHHCGTRLLQMGRTWHSQVYDAAVAQSTVTLRRIGERADSPEGERAFVALLGFLHGGVAVGGVAVLGWCCCRSYGCASGTELPIVPLDQQIAAEALAAASTQPPPPGMSDDPGAESEPVSGAGAAAAAPGSTAVVAERSASEEARLLSWSITYLRELATSILQMDARIDRGAHQSRRRLRLPPHHPILRVQAFQHKCSIIVPSLRQKDIMVRCSGR